jgi:hypothetical protein
VVTRTVDGIAALIREVDGDRMDRLSPTDLGGRVARWLTQHGLISTEAQENAVEDFVYDTVRGAGLGQPKPTTPNALAELIVAEFDLDEEH